MAEASGIHGGRITGRPHTSGEHRTDGFPLTRPLSGVTALDSAGVPLHINRIQRRDKRLQSCDLNILVVCLLNGYATTDIQGVSECCHASKGARCTQANACRPLSRSRLEFLQRHVELSKEQYKPAGNTKDGNHYKSTMLSSISCIYCVISALIHPHLDRATVLIAVPSTDNVDAAASKCTARSVPRNAHLGAFFPFLVHFMGEICNAT